MANISYDAFLPSLLPSIRNCPDPTIEEAIRSTVIDICERTEMWQADLDPISLIAGTYEYDLEPPTQSIVHRIINVVYEGDPLDPSTMGLINQRFRDWKTQWGKPKLWVKEGQALVRFVPIPKENQAAAVDIRVVLKPTITSGGADAYIMTDARDAIINGALSRIMSIPGRDWSNGKAADRYLALYSEQIEKLTKRARQANTGAVAIVQYNDGFTNFAPRKAYDSRTRIG